MRCVSSGRLDKTVFFMACKARCCLVCSIRGNAVRLIPPFLLATILSASCASIEPSSAEALETEVTSRVQEGMSLSITTSALSSRGFLCREGTSTNPRGKGIYECTRSRGALWPPYSCIHRIEFESDVSNGSISRLQVFRPMCASF